MSSNTSPTILSILDQLDATTKRTEKLEILKANSSNALMAKVFKYALDPFYKYYIKKSQPYQTVEVGTMDLDEAITKLDDLRNRTYTGNAAIAHLRNILESVSTHDAIVIERIIKGDLRCGVAESTINSVFKKLIPTYPVLLATAFKKEYISMLKFPMLMQLKADGARTNAIVTSTGTNLSSRQGREITAHSIFDEDMAKLRAHLGYDFVIDGELVCFEADGTLMSRKKGNGIVNKAVRGTISEKEAKMMRFQVWDIIPYDEFVAGQSKLGTLARFEALTAALVAVNMPSVTLIESETVYDIERVYEKFNQNVENGLEGVMLKDMNELWADKRSKNVHKFKSEYEADLKITGFNPGTGKFAGKVGSIIFESGDGLLEVSVSGMSDKFRDEITRDIAQHIAEGRIGTVKHNGKIDKKVGGKYSLFLPRLVKLRYDKTEADTIDLID